MRPSLHKLLLRVAIVILFAVVAYWIGWSNGIVPAKVVNAHSPQNVQSISADLPITPDTESPDRLTPEQALRRELEKLDQLIKLSPSSDRDAMVEMQFLKLANLDPATAFSKIGLIADQDKRHEIADRILGIWLFKDTNQGLAELAKLPLGKQTQSDYLHAFQTWAGLNPNAPPLAAATALSLPPGPERAAAMSGVVASWSHYDPQTTLDWAGSLAPADSAAVKDTLVAVGKMDPNLAAQYVDKLTDATARSQAIQNISLSMSQADPATALAWLDQVATGEAYDKSVVQIIAGRAYSNPTSATDLLAQVTGPGVSDAVIANVTSSPWARINPKGATVWLQTLPESEARNSAIQTLTEAANGK